MRWLLVLLLVIPFSHALVVESTGMAGERPVLYGDTIAYERSGVIYVYDISRHEEREIARGINPSLFGYTVAFETPETDADLNEDGDSDDLIIQFANVQDKKVTSTRAVGRNPKAFSSMIVFSTKESELGVDFSNDGDLDDDVVRQYDIDKNETINLKAVGDYPVLNQRSLVFLTEEGQVSTDLNSDGDKNDVVLRVFDKDKRQVANTKIAASAPAMAKSGNTVFASEGEIVLFDSLSQKSTELNQSGSLPTISGDVIIFERDGELYGFSLEAMNAARLNVLGSQPSLFEDIVAFVSPEEELGDLNNNGKSDEFIIRYAKEEDIDGDDVSDFVDNCPAVINADQADSNSDGIGDACEEKKIVSKNAEKSEEEKAEAVPESTSEPLAERESERGISWYWVLLIIVLLPFACYYGYKYYKKRQKSFGF